MAREIYLDNNATTQVAPEVADAVVPFLTEHYGNPSSLHEKGVFAERAVKEARKTIAGFLKADAREVFFTSGATESNNLAIRGILRANGRRGKHIVATTVEHEAVLDTLMDCSDAGFTVSFIAPDEAGGVSPENVAKAVRKDTVLVCVMHVNNELGTINPITDIARAVKAKNPETYVFSDGAQAFGKLSVDVTHIDLYSASGHKFHAPKGVGFLYIKNGTKIKPVQTGGGQECGMRSGTENVPSIVGLAKAAELSYRNLDENRAHMRTLREQFIDGVKQIERVRINSPEDGLENTVSASFPGVPAEVLLNALSEKGIYVSTGSACSSNKQRESHVIKALRLSDDVRASVLRFGISRYNTQEEIVYTVEALKKLVPELRRTVDSK